MKTPFRSLSPRGADVAKLKNALLLPGGLALTSGADPSALTRGRTRTHSTMAQLQIDKVFAENLGVSYGGCVRDLAASLFNKEVAQAAGVRLNPLPFVGTEEKIRFKSYWAAALQGVGCWAAITSIPEYLTDDKLLRKTVFNMQSSADLALSKVLLSKLSDDDFRRYDAIRRRLIRISQKENTEKETLARAFLSEISGIPDADVPDSRVTALSVHIGMAAGLFPKLANISKKDPGSYSRAQQKAAK